MAVRCISATCARGRAPYERRLVLCFRRRVAPDSCRIAPIRSSSPRAKNRRRARSTIELSLTRWICASWRSRSYNSASTFADSLPMDDPRSTSGVPIGTRPSRVISRDAPCLAVIPSRTDIATLYPNEAALFRCQPRTHRPSIDDLPNIFRARTRLDRRRGRLIPQSNRPALGKSQFWE